MAASALRPMMAVAREEAAIISSDAAMAVRSTVTTEASAAMRQAGHEVFNPLAIREAAEVNARQAVNASESSILSSLTHAKPGQASSTLTTSTSTVTNSLIAEARTEAMTTTTVSTESTVVGKILENEVGVTVKEAMTNAGETGLQSFAVQSAETATVALEGMVVDPSQSAPSAALRAKALYDTQPQ